MSSSTTTRGRERAEAAGGSAVVQADLTDEAAVDRMFAEAGPLDVCAAVAGVWPADDVPVWELTLERWRATVDANLTATFLTARGFLARARRPRGLARPRRLDRRPLRRGGPCRLRGREVGNPRRPAALAEERGRPPQPPRPRERRRARLDRVADDRGDARRRPRSPRSSRTMALPKVATRRGRRRPGGRAQLARPLGPRHRPGRHGRRRHGRPRHPRALSRPGRLSAEPARKD